MIGLEDASKFELVAMLGALLSLWTSLRASKRSRASELFALRQNVLLKAEIARSAGCKLNHENNSLMQRVLLCLPDGSPLAASTLEFLSSHRDHLEQCISDAVALADYVQKNVETFNKKKCRYYLRCIEPNLETLTCNQGVAEQKVNDLLEQLGAAAA
ncbi:hypothetical protein ACXX83_06620 [Pseudomonas sp. GNP012]